MRVVGLMSGTSYDAIDVAVAELSFGGSGDQGEIELVPLGALSVDHDPAVRELIAATLPPAEVPIEVVCRLDTLLGQAFAAAAEQGVSEFAGDQGADLVVSHGQTVFHWIEAGHARGTLQLGQPAWIAERTGLPVVSDLRGRDIAAGGQGAPLVPIFDLLLLPPAGDARAALNLGGIANMTVIAPGRDVIAYDLGPANALIDAATTRFHGEPYDRDGRHAAAGTVHHELLAALADHPYFQREAPKSTGKELFNAAYLSDRLTGFGELPPDDVIATVTELTARVVVADARKYGVTELVVSGGGARNPHLMRRIAEHVATRPIDDFGIPGDAKEAYAFALLGFLTVHGVPAAVPSCTGASEASVLGSITPGRSGWPRLDPPGVPPTRLRIAPTGGRIDA
jgi:anhydro-N-acetylmuramic acid kinase